MLGISLSRVIEKDPAIIIYSEFAQHQMSTTQDLLRIEPCATFNLHDFESRVVSCATSTKITTCATISVFEVDAIKVKN